MLGKNKHCVVGAVANVRKLEICAVVLCFLTGFMWILVTMYMFISLLI